MSTTLRDREIKNRGSVQQIDVSFSCVCPVIDHEFHCNIVKVAVDPRSYSQVDAQLNEDHKNYKFMCLLAY